METIKDYWAEIAAGLAAIYLYTNKLMNLFYIALVILAVMVYLKWKK